MTVKELQAVIKNKNISIFTQNDSDNELKLEDVLNEEVVSIFAGEDLIIVNIEGSKKITITELFKGVAIECGDSLVNVLENMIECRFCPISKKCKDDSSNCQKVLEKYVELE